MLRLYPERWRDEDNEALSYTDTILQDFPVNDPVQWNGYYFERESIHKFLATARERGVSRVLLEGVAVLAVGRGLIVGGHGGTGRGSIPAGRGGAASADQGVPRLEFLEDQAGQQALMAIMRHARDSEGSYARTIAFGRRQTYFQNNLNFFFANNGILSGYVTDDVMPFSFRTNLTLSYLYAASIGSSE